MKQNRTKDKIRNGEMVFGLGLDTPDPMMIDYAALAGLDFVRIDCEQGPFTLDTVEHAVRAAEAVDITPTARIPVDRAEVVLQLLNRGVTGLTFPHVQTADDAAAAVRHTKFAPEGERALPSTGGRGMHAHWAVGVTDDDAYAFANRETLVLCLIEDPVGLANVEEIAAVPGVDVITFGSADLSAATGHTNDSAHPEVRAMIADGIRRARAAGKPVGLSIGPRSVEQFDEYIELGVSVVQILPAPVLITGIRDLVVSLRR